jgi:hydroxymethylpyrimidine/phosphomethylpyrimidine kinase
VPLVVDPVLVASSGAQLLEDDAVESLVALLFPLATVVTPNVPEARVLAGDDGLDPEGLARAVHALGAQVVVVTGGHRDEVTDLFFDGTRLVPIPGERFADGAAHGSGCTHSSTLAAHLALGEDPLSAARAAKAIASAAVRDGLRSVGGGTGPVDVFGLAARFGRTSATDAPGPLT